MQHSHLAQSWAPQHTQKARPGFKSISHDDGRGHQEVFSNSLKEIQENTAKELQVLKEKHENTTKQVEVLKEKQENTTKQVVVLKEKQESTSKQVMK